MTRLSINEMTTFRWSFEEDVHQLRAAGIEAIGLWRQKLADFGEEKAADLLADSGLAVSNLLWAGGFTGSDGHTYSESLKDAAEAIRLAATLHAGCLVIYSGGRNNHTQNHARRLFLGTLKELAPLATELEVTLAVEPMHPGCAADWTFLTSLDEAVGLIDSLGSPRQAGLRYLPLGTRSADRGGHRPAARSDCHRAPGRQSAATDRRAKPPAIRVRHSPLKEIVAVPRGIGYDGDYDVELMARPSRPLTTRNCSAVRSGPSPI